MSLILAIASHDDTVRLGIELGRRLVPGDLVLLHGDLGSGKTTLAQGMLAGLGVTGPVPSPTFTLINEYDVNAASGGDRWRLYHLDLYRLRDDELDGIGFDDYLAPADGISLIEWPERAGSRLDTDYLLIEITATGNQQRNIRVSRAPTGTARFGWLDQFCYGQ
ncbi:MAG: tRNA (adenosine(37)-N6)-threonylcarbamoyltransferase complex ATPase subunit type 1 TsaE [Chloroflexia bacterium]|nr:tRNA (adenosine(37)-N6)-threonylcarbamoyltransferase complex ATPase subunit type 1 TsaE [Chloroflexia bacterium]